jgi:hypothetical protein
MLTISAFAQAEKNKVGSATAWLTFLEITFPSEVLPYRIVGNTENIVWAGQTWEYASFEVGDINESIDEIPQVSINISNVNRVLESFLLQYAYYTKTDGIQPATVKIMVANSANLASATPETTHEFEILQVSTNPIWAYITAGVRNPFRRRFPETRALKNQCQHVAFKNMQCGYAGVATTCDRSLITCRTLGNSSRYGGFQGVSDTLDRGI